MKWRKKYHISLWIVEEGGEKHRMEELQKIQVPPLKPYLNIFVGIGEFDRIRCSYLFHISSFFLIYCWKVLITAALRIRESRISARRPAAFSLASLGAASECDLLSNFTLHSSVKIHQHQSLLCPPLLLKCLSICLWTGQTKETSVCKSDFLCPLLVFGLTVLSAEWSGRGEAELRAGYRESEE